MTTNPYRYLRFCAWSGPVVLVAIILFWGIMGRNIPPYSAALDAQTFADQFLQHVNQTRIGMTLTMNFAVFYFIWGLAITKVMQAVERDNDILSTLQIWGAGFTTIILVIPPSIWLAGAFRPEALEPNILQLLYDMGWLLFDIAYTLTSMQFIAIGVCFLSDQRSVPLVPKWVSWYTLWVGIAFLPLSLMPLFKDGPFSRSGVLNYWVEFTIFFLVMLFVSIYILRAVGRLEREHTSGVTNG